MTSRALLAVLVPPLLIAAGCQRTAHLHGAWRSNEELTRQNLRSISAELTPKQREIFLDRPGFFGNLIHIYVNGTAHVIFEGECQPPTPYVTSMKPDGSIHLRFPELDRVTVIHDDQYEILLPIGGAKEVFTRVPLSQLLAEHECLREALDADPTIQE